MGPDKVDRLCQKAQIAIAQRDWDGAKQSYLMALGLRSDLPDIHYGLATVYFHQRELTSAAHHFREVTRLDPQRAGAYVNLGAVLNVLQLFDEAITALYFETIFKALRGIMQGGPFGAIIWVVGYRLDERFKVQEWTGKALKIGFL